MIRALLVWASILLPVGVGAAASPLPTPTYCAEWVRQSSEGYERLTLFLDRTLVWKTKTGDAEDVKRKSLDAEETQFYCDYYGRSEFWALSEDERSHLAGDLATQSVVRLARPDGSTTQIRFDDFSSLSPDASALRSSVEGLRLLFTQRLAPASRFTAQSLQPGTVLKRFDGDLFRVLMVDESRGIVEIEGVTEPYLFYRKIAELRFFFQPPGEPDPSDVEP